MHMQKKNGKFLIRIEDTDLERSTKEYENNILQSLNSIGLIPDQDPINQSQRSELYLLLLKNFMMMDMHITVIALKKD